MITVRLKNNLSDPAFYFSQSLGVLSVSFLIILWVYLSHLKLIDLTLVQIVVYFISIYAYMYLFTYSLVDRFATRFSSQTQSFLLNPHSVYATLFTKDFLPILVDNLPLIVVSLAVSLFSGVLPPSRLLYFLLLLIIVHLIYFFTCLIGAILQILLNWDFISFSFRFIGQTWNGSYIPLIFLSGNFLTFALYLPIFYTGVPFQLLLVPILDPRFFINIVIFLLLSFGLSYLLLRRFQAHVQE